MKFPTVTVALVSAALIFVVWDQYREKPVQVDPERFGDLAANPVERGAVFDWVTEQVPQLCQEATGAAPDSEAVKACVERSEGFQPTCRRAAYERFPSLIASDRVFQDLSLSMMSCLVRDSKPLG